MTSNEEPGRHTRRFDEQTRRYQGDPQQSYGDQGYPQQRPPFQDAGYQQSQESTAYIDRVHDGPVYDRPADGHAQAYSEAAPEAPYPAAEPEEPAAPTSPPAQRIWPWIALAVAAFLIGIIVGAAGMSTNKKSSASSPTVTVQAPPTTETQTETVTSTPKTTTTTSSRSSSSAATSSAAAGASSFGDGTWMVGTQIQPGVYTTSGGTNCFWERLSGTSGGDGDIISGDNARGAATVTIQSGDTAFKTQDCGTWTLTGH